MKDFTRDFMPRLVNFPKSLSEAILHGLPRPSEHLNFSNFSGFSKTLKIPAKWIESQWSATKTIMMAYDFYGGDDGGGIGSC